MFPAQLETLNKLARHGNDYAPDVSDAAAAALAEIARLRDALIATCTEVRRLRAACAEALRLLGEVPAADSRPHKTTLINVPAASDVLRSALS